MNFFKKVNFIFLLLQEKFLWFRLSKSIQDFEGNPTKTSIDRTVFFDMEKNKQENNLKFEDEIRLVLKNSDYKQEKILHYISSQGTFVYKNISTKILNLIKEKSGFLYPQTGLKALYLSIILDKKIRFKTNEMFILTEKELDIYMIAYNFYNWYTYKNNISKIDNKTIKFLTNYINSQARNIKINLSKSDMQKLLLAAKQEKAASSFALKLCNELYLANKIKENESENISEN